MDANSTNCKFLINIEDNIKTPEIENLNSQVSKEVSAIESLNTNPDNKQKTKNENNNREEIIKKYEHLLKENSEIDDDIGESSSGMIWINIAINLFFVFSYLNFFRNDDAYQMNNGILLKLESTPFKLDPLLYFNDISSMDDAGIFIDNVLFQNIFGSIMYAPILFNRSQAPSGIESLNYSFINTWVLFEGMKINVYWNKMIQNQNSQESYFFDGLATYQDVIQKFGLVLDSLKNNTIAYIHIEFIMFNIINDVGFFYSIKMSVDRTSAFILSTETLPFFPKVYDDDAYDSSISNIMISSTVLFAIQLFFLTLSVIIKDIYKTIKNFVETHRVELDKMVIFNVAYATIMQLFLFISLILFERNKNSFNRQSVFKKADEFEAWKHFAYVTRDYIRLFAFVIYFIFIKNLMLLKSKFPSFGVLFYTLSRSRLDLALYLICLLTLLISMVTTIKLCFGSDNIYLASLGSSFFKTFQFTAGDEMYSYLKSRMPYLSMVIFFFFYFEFNLALMNIFSTIIMTTYTKLRTEMQLTTLALTALAKEKSNELKNKWLNLIMFKKPSKKNANLPRNHQQNQKLNINPNYITEEDDDNNSNEENNDIEEQNANNSNKNKNKMTLFEILLYNIEELEWFGLRSKNNETREEMEKIRREKKIKILIEKEKAEKEKLQSRADSLFDKLAGVVLFLIFNILFVTMLTYQLMNDVKFDLHQAIVDELSDSEFKVATPDGMIYEKKFDKISDILEINNWITDVFMPIVYPNFTSYYAMYNNSMNHNIEFEDPEIYDINQILDQTLIIGPHPIRITVRKIHLSHQTTANIDWYIRQIGEINSNDPPQADEVTSSKFTTANIFDDNKAINITYSESGDFTTHNQNGGFTFNFNRNLSQVLEMYYNLSAYGVINIDLATTSLQFLFYNPNYQMIGLNTVIFDYTVNGIVNKKIETKAIPLHFYPDGLWKRIFLEVLYVIFVIKKCIDVIRNWKKIWIKHQNLFPCSKKLQNKNYISRLLNYDTTGEINVKEFIIAILKRIYQFVNRFLTATYDFFSKSMSNLIFLLSNIFSIVAIVYIIMIISNQFRNDFYIKDLNLSQYNPTSSLEIMGNFERLLYLQDQYIFFQSINSWLYMAVILCELKFSGDMSIILELFEEALLDIIFFILMFTKVMIAFALAGYFSFGAVSDSFNTLIRSFIQCLLIILGLNDANYLIDCDPITGVIYYFLFMIIIYFIVFKMFIAILYGHFSELTQDGKGENNGILKLILIILETKMDEIKKQNDEPEPPENAKFFIKVNWWIKKITTTIITRAFNLLTGKMNEKDASKPDSATKTKNNLQIDFHDNNDQSISIIEDIKIYMDKPASENILQTKGSQEFESSSINKGISQGNKTGKDNSQDISVQKSKTIASWMLMLENNITTVSEEKIKFKEYGSQSKDFLDDYEVFNQDLKSRLNARINEIKNDPTNGSIDDGDIMINIQNEAETFYKKNPKKFNIHKTEGLKNYNKLIEYINLLMFYGIYSSKNNKKSRIKSAKISSNKPNEYTNGYDGILEINPLPDYESEKLLHPVLSFWNMLPVKIQCKILIDNHSNDFSVMQKLVLFSNMKFPLRFFEDFCVPSKFKTSEESTVGKKELQYIMEKLSIDDNNKDNAKEENDIYSKKSERVRKNNPDKLLHEENIMTQDIELQQLKSTKEDKNMYHTINSKEGRSSARSYKPSQSFIIKNDKDDEELDIQAEQPHEKRQLKLTINHIKLVEQILYGKGRKYNDIFIKIKRQDTLKGKINFLKYHPHVAGNPKLVLWYLMPPMLKMVHNTIENYLYSKSQEFIQNCKSKKLARFMMLMLMEEIANNPYFLTKIERNFATNYKSQIYMHFFLFAQAEALVSIYKNIFEDPVENMLNDYVEYVKYLENQKEHLKIAKETCLIAINEAIENEKIIEEKKSNMNQISLEKIEEMELLHISHLKRNKIIVGSPELSCITNVHEEEIIDDRSRMTKFSKTKQRKSSQEIKDSDRILLPEANVVSKKKKTKKNKKKKKEKASVLKNLDFQFKD